MIIIIINIIITIIITFSLTRLLTARSDFLSESNVSSMILPDSASRKRTSRRNQAMVVVHRCFVFLSNGLNLIS